jgi:teichuronic acid biosynthesis glycosyltransferase TuaG
VSESYSVVVPAYNADRTIEKCLTSVLSQSMAPVQVVVVDDASSDGTEEACRRQAKRFASSGIQFEYLRLPKNSGPSAARNRGIAASKGAFIAFLDADDTWAENKLAVADRFLQSSHADLICHEHGTPGELHESTIADAYREVYLSKYRMLVRNPAQTSCAVMRKRPNLEFDESMRHCEDYDLWMKIAEESVVVQLVGRPLTCLGRPQLSAGGLSGNTWRMRAGELRVYTNFCCRAPVLRIWLLPVLLMYSVLKHLYSALRRWPA